MPERVILWLSREASRSCEGFIGPKAASLCTLRRLGIRVPPCFFVTTTAFRTHIEASGLHGKISLLLDELDTQPDRIQRILVEIRRLIVEVGLDVGLQEQIAAAYKRLKTAVVAVRSSATAEVEPPGRD